MKKLKLKQPQVKLCLMWLIKWQLWVQAKKDRLQINKLMITTAKKQIQTPTMISNTTTKIKAMEMDMIKMVRVNTIKMHNTIKATMKITSISTTETMEIMQMMAPRNHMLKVKTIKTMTNTTIITTNMTPMQQVQQEQKEHMTTLIMIQVLELQILIIKMTAHLIFDM